MESPLDFAELHHRLLQQENDLRLRSDWKLLAQQDRAQVWRLDSGARHPYLRCTATIPIASDWLVETCMKNVVESQRDWVTGYMGGQVLFEEGVQSSGIVRRILMIRHARTALVVAPRHYVYFDGYGPQGEAVVQVSQSLEWRETPQTKGSVLARLVFASRRIRPAAEAGHSEYDAVWQVNLGGWLGRFPGLAQAGMVEAFFAELRALQRLAG